MNGRIQMERFIPVENFREEMVRAIALLIVEKRLPLFDGHSNPFILANGKHPLCKTQLPVVLSCSTVLVLKHGTPECRNAGTPKRRNTKTRNTKLLKPGTHEK